MAGKLCGPTAQVPTYELGVSDAEAEALLGEYFDCYHSDSDFRALTELSLGDDSEVALLESLMSDRDLFVGLALLGARQDPESAESLQALRFALDAM